MRLAILGLLLALGSRAEAARDFQDCRDCPVMVTIPAGRFLMGARPEEPGHTPSELPTHAVTIPTAFAIGKFDLTRTEFTAFANATGYKIDSSKCDWRAPRAHGQPLNQSATDPVVCVSWTDANAYAEWLSRKTGKSYRLPAEAEWEYAARGGTNTTRPWGDGIGRDNANYGSDQCCAPFAAGKDRWLYTSPAASFPANAFGLYDMLGNIWQWVQDCSHSDYSGALAIGTVWAGGDCSSHMVRGGAWFQAPDLVRSATRAADKSDFRIADIGFRVARSL